jgi:hypothetical protein
MRYLRLGLAATVAIIVVMMPTLASATPLATRESVIRGIPASQSAAVILERRIGSERERQLIGQYEASMRDLNRDATARAASLRTAIVRAQTLETQSRAATAAGRQARIQLVALQAQNARDQAQAKTQTDALQAERDRYVALVEEMMNREASTLAELEAWKRAATTIGADTSQERLDLLQQYIDGDRVAALDGLSELRELRRTANANIRAARERLEKAAEAADWRRDARLEATAQDRGERTAEQVLRVWDGAAALDPSDSSTFREISELNSAIGRQVSAFRAQRLALSSAKRKIDRLLALDLDRRLKSKFQPDVEDEGDALGYSHFSAMFIATSLNYEQAAKEVSELPSFEAFLNSWEAALSDAFEPSQQFLERSILLQSTEFPLALANYDRLLLSINSRRILSRIRYLNGAEGSDSGAEDRIDLSIVNLVKEQLHLASSATKSLDVLVSASLDLRLINYYRTMSRGCDDQMLLNQVRPLVLSIRGMLLDSRFSNSSSIQKLGELANSHSMDVEFYECIGQTQQALQSMKIVAAYRRDLVRFDYSNIDQIQRYFGTLIQVLRVSRKISEYRILNEELSLLEAASKGQNPQINQFIAEIKDQAQRLTSELN